MKIEKSVLEAFVAADPKPTDACQRVAALLELSKRSEAPEFLANVLLNDGFQHHEEWEDDAEPDPLAVLIEIALVMADVLERVEGSRPRIFPVRRAETFEPSELPPITDLLLKANQFEEAAGDYMDRYHNELESLLDEIATIKQRRDALFALLPKTEA